MGRVKEVNIFNVLVELYKHRTMKPKKYLIFVYF
jgi:hypothetical protein